jgi:hypothetical protein
MSIIMFWGSHIECCFSRAKASKSSSIVATLITSHEISAKIVNLEGDVGLSIGDLIVIKSSSKSNASISNTHYAYQRLIHVMYIH